MWDFQTKPSKSYRSDIQNSAARILTQSSQYEHITPIHHWLHRLPVAFRVNARSSRWCTRPCTMKHLITSLTCSSFNCILEGLRSSSEVQLVEPVVRLNRYGRCAFSFVGPTLWNTLPSACPQSLLCWFFKQKLKSCLFLIAYTTLTFSWLNTKQTKLHLRMTLSEASAHYKCYVIIIRIIRMLVSVVNWQ